MQALLDVLACSDDGDGAAPRLDAAGWNAFVDEASRHGVAALAYRRLSHRATVPRGVMQTLEGHYLKNRLRNLRLFARLSVLLEALHAASINVIVLKGAYLAHAIYGDPALRAMADADLMVRERDLDRAARVLRTAGWQHGAALQGGGHQLATFVLEGVQVELHWNIEDDAAPYAVDVTGLWQRALPARVGHAPAHALVPEDLLLHLCMHSAYGHSWKQFDGGLRQLADISAVLRHHDSAFDWPAFVTRAAAWRVDRSVSLCLVVARELLRTPVPQAVIDELAQPPARWIALARELALGRHYAELARCLPALSRPWLQKSWLRLSGRARWREHLLPARATLSTAYPTLRERPAWMRPAHWNDLTADAIRLMFDRKARAIASRERERWALIAWLEVASAADAIE